MVLAGGYNEENGGRICRQKQSRSTPVVSNVLREPKSQAPALYDSVASLQFPTPSTLSAPSSAGRSLG